MNLNSSCWVAGSTDRSATARPVNVVSDIILPFARRNVCGDAGQARTLLSLTRSGVVARVGRRRRGDARWAEMSVGPAVELGVELCAAQNAERDDEIGRAHV